MMRKKGLILIAVVLLAISSTTAVAADPVKVGESLQAAVDAAADGSVILVEPGTHQVSNLTISGKGITLRALAGPETTILSISGSHSIGLVFDPRTGNQSTIEGFTLTKATWSAVKIDGASPNFKNCLFIDNMSYIYRGAACRVSNGSPSFENCSFVNGWTDSAVGGVAATQSHPVFKNCSFRGNQSPHIENTSGTASIINCTFIGTTGSNPAYRNRAIVYNYDSAATIVNTIIRLDWSNGAVNAQPAVGNNGTASASISYSDIEGSGGSSSWNLVYGTDGGHNIDKDPLLVSPTDFHLTALSPCINAGIANGAPAQDVDGDPRPIQGIVDMGVDEYNQLPIIETFNVYPEKIKTDETAHINWKVAQAESVRIDPGIGVVGSSGGQSVSPDTTTVYTLTATNIVGNVTREVTLNVDLLPQIISFSAFPSSIQSCTGSTLAWETGSAETVTIQPEISPDLPLDGSQQVFPQSTTTYRIVARRGDKTAEDTVTITVSGTNDSDGDGLLNVQEDENQNGVLDSGETDPCSPDTDNDGLPDGWEARFGFDPTVADDPDADPDGDGYSNALEYFGDSNPTDSGSIPYVLDHHFDDNGNLIQTNKVVVRPKRPSGIHIIN
jgi:Bacterial TSP3 repeat